MSTPQEPLVVEEVAPGVTRIALTVPGLADGVNVHLVRGGGGPTTLVDAAMPLPGALEALERGLRTAGAELGDLEQVVLTHHHLDHVGLAGEIARRTGAAVLALGPVAEVLAAPLEHYERELRWAEEHAARHGAPDALLDGTRGARPLIEAVRGVGTDRVLADGDVVRAGPLELTVRHRPGHSPTDTLLLDAERDLAFVGDHLFRAAPLTPVLGAMLAPEARPAAVYLRALQETAAHDGLLALPGHGPALPDPAGLIRDRHGALDRRTGRVRDALGPEPASTWELGVRVWRGVPSQAHGLTRLAALLASLELLEDAGAATRAGGPDAVRWVAGPEHGAVPA
jgi:glyoxylase-like metal-dependent hydrolase (beta-lactamase superfamily II)